MFAAALPAILGLGIPALLGAISGSLGIANQVKQLKGGRLRRMHGGALRRKHKRGGAMHRKPARKPKKTPHHRRRGRGIAADIAGSIPLLGGILGPVIRAFGGRLTKRGGMHGNMHNMAHTIRAILHQPLLGAARLHGRGLSPMYIQHPYVGAGLRKRKHGHGLSPMYIQHPYVGAGLRGHRRRGGMLTPPGGHYQALLSQLAQGMKLGQKALLGHSIAGPSPSTVGFVNNPYRVLIPTVGARVPISPSIIHHAGKGLVHRKGYYKRVKGKRIHVRPAIVHHAGSGMLVRRKGYYKRVKGKRIHVRPALVHRGRGLLGPAGFPGRGGYMPYRF